MRIAWPGAEIEPQFQEDQHVTLFCPTMTTSETCLCSNCFQYRLIFQHHSPNYRIPDVILNLPAYMHTGGIQKLLFGRPRLKGSTEPKKKKDY